MRKSKIEVTLAVLKAEQERTLIAYKAAALGSDERAEMWGRFTGLCFAVGALTPAKSK